MTIAPGKSIAADAVILYRKPDRANGENPEDYIEEERQIPPDGGWGWIIVISGFFAHVLSDGVMYAFGVILDELMIVFSATATEVTFVGSLLPAVILGIGPIASTLITLFGARAITIAGSIIATLALCASYFAPSLLFLSIAVGLFCGIGFGIVYLPAIVMVSYYFEKRRSFAMGLTVAGSGVGTVALPPLLSMLIHEYGWRWTFAIMGALVLNCVACGLVLLPLKPTKVWVKKSGNENVDILDTITRDSEAKEALVNGNGTGVIHSLTAVDTTGRRISVEVTSEPEDNAHEEVKEPLLNGRKTNEVFLEPGNGDVKFRRANSHSPSQLDNKRARSHSHIEDGAVSPHTIGTTSPSGHSRLKQISVHQSQLLPEQRINPDLVVRPDLLYPASLTHIPLYTSNRELFVRQVSTYVSQSRLATQEEDELDFPAKTDLWTQISDSLKNSFDFTLFRDIPFLLLSISSFLTSLGYNAPYLYIVIWGRQEIGFSEKDAAYLSTFIGIGNIVGRLFFGFLADHPKVSRMLLYIVSLILCGICTVISPFYAEYWWMVCYALAFGVLIGAYVSLTPLLLVDLLGLHRLEVAFGILGLIQCIATLIGPPVLATLRDTSGSFTILFYTCGSMIGLSGVMLIPVFVFYDKIRTKVTEEERELGRAETLAGGVGSEHSTSDSSEDTQQKTDLDKA